MTCITSQMICKNYNFADIVFEVNLKLIMGKYNRFTLFHIFIVSLLIKICHKGNETTFCFNE